MAPLRWGKSVSFSFFALFNWNMIGGKGGRGKGEGEGGRVKEREAESESGKKVTGFIDGK